jgi:ribose/xylose/arabinose/galactoside ABC-type transport system permease subunit
MKSNKTLDEMAKQYGLYIILFLLILVFSICTERFLTFTNMINILKRISITGILSLGTLFVIISGGIDISVGAVAALSSVIMATVLVQAQAVSILVLMLLGVGLIIGLIIGSVIAKGKVPPIITTLAMLSIIRGALMIATGGYTIEGLDHPLVDFLGRGKILGIPVMVLVMFAAYLFSAFILKKTQFGRYIYAIGGDEEVCRHSGVPVVRVKIMVYIYAACMSVLGGVILCSRLGVGQPTALDGIELDCIASVILGGASLSGGKGTVLHTFLGVLIIGLLINGMNYLNIVTYWQYIIQGVVILFATLIYSDHR